MKYFIYIISFSLLFSENIYIPVSEVNLSIRPKSFDRLYFERGGVYFGQIYIKNKKNIVISSYGDKELSIPVIKSDGYKSGILIKNSRDINISNIGIVSNGKMAFDETAKTQRYGIFIDTSSHIYIDKCNISHIFSSKEKNFETWNRQYSRFHNGKGVYIKESSDIIVMDNNISRLGFYGIQLWNSRNVFLKENRITHTGGSGIEISTSKNVFVTGNYIEHSGSKIDRRMKGRGSGAWCWKSSHIVFEGNTFKDAHGEADSCGVHIDYWCDNVLIQHNKSIHNAGGFVEILGGGFNNIYRYNTSINDGYRVKGINGARQDGKTIWLSGFVGGKRLRNGPFNSYVYGNRIETNSSITPRIYIDRTAQNVLIFDNNMTFDGQKIVYKNRGINVLLKNNRIELKNNMADKESRKLLRDNKTAPYSIRKFPNTFKLDYEL